MSIKRLKVRARQGPDLLPSQILQALRDALTAELGPWSPKFLTLPSVKFKTTVNVGKPGRGKQVEKILADLDFTTGARPVLSYIGGTRQEINNKLTFVTYSPISGVVVISTNVVE